MKTGAVLIRELRYMIDEPVEVKWSDDQLLQYLNEGSAQVNMLLKSTEQRWHVRVLSTASAPLTIFGATYTPATALLVASAAATLTLPRDCMEILHLLPLLAADRLAGYQFHPSQLSRYRFEQFSLTAGVSTDRQYFYTFQGQTTLRIAPALNTEMDFELHYVYSPSEITRVLDVDQVPEWAYLATKLFAKHLAYQQISHPETNSMYQAFELEIRKITSYGSPRTTPTVRVVEGAFDEQDGLDQPARN